MDRDPAWPGLLLLVLIHTCSLTSSVPGLVRQSQQWESLGSSTTPMSKVSLFLLGPAALEEGRGSVRMIEAIAIRAQASPRRGSKSLVQGDDGLSPGAESGCIHLPHPPTAAHRARLLRAAFPQAQSIWHSQEQCRHVLPAPRPFLGRGRCHRGHLVLGFFKDTLSRHTLIFAFFSRMGKASALWQVLDASGYSPEPSCLPVGQGPRWEQLLFHAEHVHFQGRVHF